MARLGFWLSPRPMRAKARELIERYNVKTPSTETPIRDLSGGNVQRAVLARELSGDVDVLIVANPCFGLDFASVADIRAQIMEQRNRGAAVLLVSEDLDEILELSDRIAVMSGGKVAYLTRRPRRRPHHHRPPHGRALSAFAGVMTEARLQTSMREANDRGAECRLAEDATAGYFPAFKAETVRAAGRHRRIDDGPSRRWRGRSPDG